MYAAKRYQDGSNKASYSKSTQRKNNKQNNQLYKTVNTGGIIKRGNINEMNLSKSGELDFQFAKRPHWQTNAFREGQLSAKSGYRRLIKDVL